MFNIHAYRYYLCGNYIKTEDNPPPKFFPCCLQIQYLSFCNDSEQNSKMFMHLYLQEMRFFCQIECITQKKCECTCKTVEKRWRIHVHANNKINTFYFRMHCKFSKTIRIWKNKILSSLTNAIYFFLLIQVMRKRNECLIHLFFASYRWHITHVWTSPVFVLIYELRRLNRTWNH